jgi:SAM-dependent methyltransferase
MIDKIELIKDINDNDRYCPIMLNGELLEEGNKRKSYNQHIRIFMLSENIDNNSSYLDLGCNTGYIYKELIMLNHVKVTAIEIINSLVKLCKNIEEIEKTGTIIIHIDIVQYIHNCIKKNIKFDNVTMLSVWNFDEINKNINKMLMITKDKLFLEPTNHEGYDIEMYNKIYIKPFQKKYNATVLGYTDYQNRPLIMVTK